MEAFLTFAVIVSFLYMCLVVFAVFQEWYTGRNLSQEPQSPDESGG